jgi:hypothetical protein
VLTGYMWLRRLGPVEGCCEHSKEPLGSMKCGEFVDYLTVIFLRRVLLHGVCW